MLDEAVKGKQGERTDLKLDSDSNLLYNIQEVDGKAPTGTSRAAGLRKLRKLRKHAANNPEVAK